MQQPLTSAELMTTSSGVTLVDVATGSQAWTEPAGDGWTVHQHGPLALWGPWKTPSSPGRVQARPRCPASA
ncbi:hypothetical protein J2Z21_008715 [Streptomyces griseochromogenes]|uniref:Uncharacterized protein n=1 Tax=Streptomyces griseochromogenes TaxID=68214 RepID=A0ABS4M8I8_9ACTN|nr:hypothetical protein [Streptomyces griseochromogenes]